MNAEEFHHITLTPHLQPRSIVVGGFILFFLFVCAMRLCAMADEFIPLWPLLSYAPESCGNFMCLKINTTKQRLG